MLEAEERERYIQGARLRCWEGSKYRVRRAASAITELGTAFVYRGPNTLKGSDWFQTKTCSGKKLHTLFS